MWIKNLNLALLSAVLANDEGNVIEMSAPGYLEAESLMAQAGFGNTGVLDSAWGKFKAAYDKIYESAAEEERKMETWLRNLAHIETHNKKYESGDKTYKLEMNVYGDMTHEEFKVRNGYKIELKAERAEKVRDSPTYRLPLNYDEDNLAKNVDWRDHGYVTEVKNQGHCGSCWSFSTTGALEGQMKRKTGKLPSLSEQNLVDCSKENNGCNGGLMDYAFDFIKEEHGIDTEVSYPYEGTDGHPCRYRAEFSAGDDVGFVDIPSGSEKHLKHALATQGPVAVAIDAGHRSFQFYSSGIYYEPECSSQQLDHGVLAVGYGQDCSNGDETCKHGAYWIVKNSWGEEWGDGGFIKMARNRHNHCGIATAASYPLV